MGGPNHPFVVWGSCFLWLGSLFAISWSITLFYCVGHMLVITGTDIVIAIVLLSGIIMLPTNVFMIYTIGNGQKISHMSKVLCCPLWVLMVWIIFVNCVGIALCIQKITAANCVEFLMHSMKHYRSVPRYKRFMDNVQWGLKCCGLNSYKDWFKYDWFEKLRDYEWFPTNKQKSPGIQPPNKDMPVADSVPLSCCKSGTCVPNYLLELGTHSIYTKGCFKSMDRIYITSMSIQLIFFLAVVITQVITLYYQLARRLHYRKVILLSCIMGGNHTPEPVAKNITRRIFSVRHIMPINNKFVDSSSSASVCADDSDDEIEGFQTEKSFQ